MKLHDLKPVKGSRKPKRRVGQGLAAGRGKYAGKGIKGQGARGRSSQKRAYFEGGQLPLVRRLPFKRGFKNLFRINYQEINVADLEKMFDAGAVVSPETLVEKGLLRSATIPVVILAQGDLTKKLTVHAHRISKTALEKVESAGGSYQKIELLITGAFATVKKLSKEKIAALRASKNG